MRCRNSAFLPENAAPQKRQLVFTIVGACSAVATAGTTTNAKTRIAVKLLLCALQQQWPLYCCN